MLRVNNLWTSALPLLPHLVGHSYDNSYLGYAAKTLTQEEAGNQH